MLMHIVSFKYRSDVDEATRNDHRARLRALAGLEGISDLKAGADVVGSMRSFDTGLVVSFSNRAALDRYQTDARHVPVARFGAGLCDQIVSVDFEVG